MIKGIAFDLEGTVIDVEEAHHKAHLNVARDAGVLLTLDEAILKIPHFIGGPGKVLMQELYDLSNKSLSPEAMLQRGDEYYEEFLASLTIAPRPGFLDFLETAQRHGLEIAIGSLTPKNQATKLLEHSGLLKLFPMERITLEEHVKNLKPAPDVFLETARRMNISPNEQLVFEDSPRGVQAALTAGSKAIGMPVYKRSETIDALWKAGASKVFLDWKSVNLAELLQEL